MKKLLFEGLGDGLRVLKVVAIVAIPVCILMFHVWNQFRITKLGYEVAEQTTEHRDLIEAHRKLTIEATFQGRSERVASSAKQRFGLEPLQLDQVVAVDEQRSAAHKQASLELSQR